MVDQDGYPTDAELRRIETWDITSLHETKSTEKRMLELVDYIVGLWWHADEGIIEYDVGGTHYLKLHTLGWSGNEDIIGALEVQTTFNKLFRYYWRGGGHYYYRW